MPNKVLVRYDLWDLNMGRVPGYRVENPPGWDAISLHYAKALQHMGWKHPASPDANVDDTWTFSDTDPTTYYFQAAIHGTPDTDDTTIWNHCTHASGDEWFLPWHRIYVYWFEVIVRSLIPALDGPADWALPYWNYSLYDQHGHPDPPWPRAGLPWVFGQPTLPDGSGNPLYMNDARRGLRPGRFLRTTTPYYDQAYAEQRFLGQAGLAGFTQTLEQQPHNVGHVDIGRGGWMNDVSTAGFDPVFWLHHTEIDRFWVGWNANGHSDPTDSAWLHATNDPLPARWDFWRDADLANKVRTLPADVLDPEHLAAPLPHAYRYANLPQVPAPVHTGTAQRLRALGAPVPPTQPSAAKNSVLGTAENVSLRTDAPVSTPIHLAGEAASTLAPVTAPAERGAAAEEAPRVILHLESITADGPPCNYEVYVNYPDATYETAGDHPHYVGVLGGFGADHRHGGHAHGIRADFDITDLVRYLDRTGGWDPARVTVTFVPTARQEDGYQNMGAAGLRVGHMSIRTLSASE